MTGRESWLRKLPAGRWCGRRHIRRTAALEHPDRRARVLRPPRREEACDCALPARPYLDPQLVWKGKDEQDARDLEVPAVPIYIQETIDSPRDRLWTTRYAVETLTWPKPT